MKINKLIMVTLAELRKAGTDKTIKCNILIKQMLNLQINNVSFTITFTNYIY